MSRTYEEPDVSWLHDDRGARLMVGVETDHVQLAAVVPEDVPRAKVHRAIRECSRELEHYVEAESDVNGAEK